MKMNDSSSSHHYFLELGAFEGHQMEKEKKSSENWETKIAIFFLFLFIFESKFPKYKQTPVNKSRLYNFWKENLFEKNFSTYYCLSLKWIQRKHVRNPNRYDSFQASISVVFGSSGWTSPKHLRRRIKTKFSSLK